jgi:hypothetical protein
MMKRTYTLEAEDDGAGGFIPLTLDKSNLGFDPSETFISVQISAGDLDGGDYTVQFKPHKGLGFVGFEENVPTTSAVLVNNGYALEAVRVSFDNTGAAAAPKAVVTFISRSF